MGIGRAQSTSGHERPNPIEPFDLGTLTQVTFDYSLTLRYSSEATTTIGSEFTIIGDDELTVDPPEWSPAAASLVGLLHQDAVATLVQDSLQLVFTDGVRVVVNPDPRYEAWQHHNADGELLVATPGGGVAHFAARRPR